MVSSETGGLLLSLIAGLCTAVGGGFIYLTRTCSRLPVAMCLAISAGVMIYVSFVEIFPNSQETIQEAMKIANYSEPARTASLATTCCFVAGWVLASLLDKALEIVTDYFNLAVDGDADSTLEKNHVNECSPSTIEASLPTSVVAVLPQASSEDLHPGLVDLEDNRDGTPATMTPATDTPHMETRAPLTAPDSGSNAVQKRKTAAVESLSGAANAEVSDTASSSHIRAKTASNSSNDYKTSSGCRNALSRVGNMLKSCVIRSVPESQREEVEYAEKCFRRDHRSFLKMGIVTAVTLAIHNFPEGIATYTSNLDSTKSGVSMAVAIAIHNIPEGIAVAFPLYQGTRKRFLAFFYSMLTGLAEPLGALLASFAITSPENRLLLGSVNGVVAGVMVNVAITELLFSAIKYDPCNQVCTSSVFGGIIIMGTSLVALQYSGLD